MTDPRIIAQPDQAEGPSLADVDELCAEFGFRYADGETWVLGYSDTLEILQQVITAAITRWRAPVVQPAAHLPAEPWLEKAVGELLGWSEIDGKRIRVSITVLEPCPVDEWRPIARKALERLTAPPVAPPTAEALTHGRALLAQAEARAEDADLFRLWIHEASARPGRIAKAISSCVTPDDYREALRKLAPDYSNRAYPVDLAALHDPDFSGGLTPDQHLDVLWGGPDPRVTATPAPEEPETERVLRLAKIIREADPADRIGGWAHQLAQALLEHPGFSDCHDGPAALPAQGEVDELVAALEADAECAEVEHYDLCNMTAAQMRRTAELLKGTPVLPAQGFQIGPQEYIPHA